MATPEAAGPRALGGDITLAFRSLFLAGPARAATADPLACHNGGAAPVLYSHAVVIMEENLSYATYLRSTTSMPYLKSLGAACGSESNMVGTTHPSANNHLSATSGQLSRDSTLTVDKTSENIFHQMQATGQTWANYAESEPNECHDVYYVSACKSLYGTGSADRFRLGDDRLSTMVPAITATAITRPVRR